MPLAGGKSSNCGRIGERDDFPESKKFPKGRGGGRFVRTKAKKIFFGALNAICCED